MNRGCVTRSPKRQVFIWEQPPQELLPRHKANATPPEESAATSAGWTPRTLALTTESSAPKMTLLCLKLQFCRNLATKAKATLKPPPIWGREGLIYPQNQSFLVYVEQCWVTRCSTASTGVLHVAASVVPENMLSFQGKAHKHITGCQSLWELKEVNSPKCTQPPTSPLGRTLTLWCSISTLYETAEVVKKKHKVQRDARKLQENSLLCENNKTRTVRQTAKRPRNAPRTRTPTKDTGNGGEQHKLSYRVKARLNRRAGEKAHSIDRVPHGVTVRCSALTTPAWTKKRLDQENRTR